MLALRSDRGQESDHEEDARHDRGQYLLQVGHANKWTSYLTRERKRERVSHCIERLRCTAF